MICFEPQKKHFLCSKPLTPLKASQHKDYSDSWLFFVLYADIDDEIKDGFHGAPLIMMKIHGQFLLEFIGADQVVDDDNLAAVNA